MRAAAALFLALSACSSPDSGASTQPPPSTANPSSDASAGGSVGQDAVAANVEAVSASGGAGAYTFSVTLRSADTGCEQYADWWEVLDHSGGLLYRRILAHSHVDEQPFTRTGGPVAVQPDTTVVIRAHISTTGYGGTMLRGTVSGGFEPATDLPADFAADVERQTPQPTGCAF